VPEAGKCSNDLNQQIVYNFRLSDWSTESTGQSAAHDLWSAHLYFLESEPCTSTACCAACLPLTPVAPAVLTKRLMST